MATAEIASSFHRPHRRALYARWAASVPTAFRFAVKLPRDITHDRRLVGVDDAVEAFLEQVGGLGSRCGPLLIQLPPSLAFEARTTARFLTRLRARHPGALACEPRHPSWFAPAPDRLLAQYQVARVAADPARVPAAAEPGGWQELVYLRLHGSPLLYRSPYPEPSLAAWAARIRAWQRPTWCFFDNTMSSAALPNALRLLALVRT